MTAINPPAWMQAGTYPARNDRLALTGLMSYPGFSGDEATPLRIRQGVKPSYQNYQLKVRAASTPNMTVIVSGGIAFIDQHDTGGVGTYICVNDADVILNVSPAGGAGQFRKDTVVASVYDAEYAGTASEWRLEIIQGPYAASAGATVRGSLPSNAQVLADISIGPSQSSVTNANIVDIRNYSVAAGGIVPLSSSLDMNHPAPGQFRYLMDTDRILYGKQDGTSGEVAKVPGAWTSYTPAWTGSTTNPSIGNGTLTGRYTKLGPTVMCEIFLIPGSTTTFGSGTYLLSVPFAKATATEAVGAARLTAGSVFLGHCILGSGANTMNVTFPNQSNNGLGQNWGNTVPATFAAGHTLRMSITYEAAS
ncbi:hypothetical protein ABZ890_39750 [Streptomyces sp. NPDC046984]|uniref:hypothetical protein n=1 Tax=Streptomyces sp. NPDC046984 TaxID=3155138 RepID=UPI0033E19EFF